MKRIPADLTVAQLTDRLRRSQRFSEADLHAIEGHWRSAGGDIADVARFARWLVARGYLTEEQVDQFLGSNPAIPVAAAPPIMTAVIVAPPANPVLEKSAILTANLVPESPDIHVELVAQPPPDPPAREPEITVELVPTSEASTVLPPASPVAPFLPPTSIWLFLFLGGLGVLIVQFAGWVLAHVVNLFL
jgi:hypothetical protein